MPDPGEPRADQHPADRAQRRLRDLPHDHRPEGLKRGARETWREQEQKLIQRRWDAEHRRQPPWAAANEPPTRPRKWREQPPLRGSRPVLLPTSVRSGAQTISPTVTTEALPGTCPPTENWESRVIRTTVQFGERSYV